MHLYETAFLSVWPPGCDMAGSLSFHLLDQCVRFVCDDDAIRQPLKARFQTRLQHMPPSALDLAYTVRWDVQAGAYAMRHVGGASVQAAELARLWQWLDEDLGKTLRVRRPDLLHLRATALAYEGQAWLLVGDALPQRDAAAGAMLRCGFRYLGREFSPVDLEALEVVPYPYALPLEDGQAVPVHDMPCPLAGVVLLRQDPACSAPQVRSLSAAEACARLYAATIDAKGHVRRNIDASVGIAKSVPCWSLENTAPQAVAQVLLNLARTQGLAGLMPSLHAGQSSA